ncbi:MAG: hypothetical protein S4CHLAM102_05320 [Chlamydiia bacterium]|nr:hypothetical protein [Chlamydiia bacterium]
MSVSTTPPPNFSPQLEVVALLLQVEDKALYLLRAHQSDEPDHWTIPAGKLESNETPIEAIVRETLEETSIQLSPSHLTTPTTFYIQKPHLHYPFHIYQITLSTPPQVTLNPEHKSYRWLTPTQAKQLPLMSGGL